MCLLIKSAFDGFSAVCDMQALAASGTSIESVSGNTSKKFMLNEMFRVFFETDNKQFYFKTRVRAHAKR